MKNLDARSHDTSKVEACRHGYAARSASNSAVRRLANRRRRMSVLVTLILALGGVGVIYFPRAVSAVNRTWDGGGVTNNWSEAANWSGDTVPGPADVAIFDGTSTKNVTIDAASPQGANINIGMIQINPGYTGTITQAPAVNLTLAGASNFAFSQNEPLSTFNGSSGLITANNPFTVSNGTFLGGSGDIDLNNSFTLSGGSFTSTSERLSVAGNFTHTAGGSFLHNNGTVTLDDTSTSSIDVSASETFNNLTFNALNAVKNIAAGDTLIVLGTLTLADGFISDAGTVEARAGVVHQLTFDGGSGNIRIAQPTMRTITLAADGKLPNLTVNAENVTIDTMGLGTFTFSSLNLQAGTVEQGSVSFNLSGSFTQSGGTYTSGSSDLTVGNSFTLSGGSFSQASGLLRVTNPLTVSNGTFIGGSGDIDLNNSFTLSGGSFTSTSGGLSVAGNFTHTAGGSFLHNNGTVTLDGTSTSSIDVSASETFNNLTFNALNAVKNIAAGDTLIVLGTLSLTDGFINTGTLSPRGNMTVASSLDGGNAMVTFSGAQAQTYTNNGGPNPTGIWTVNKSAGKVTLASNLTLGTTQALNITSGTLDLGPSFNLIVGPITIGASGILRNFGNGNLTLGGNLVNNGIFNFNGGGTGCEDANASDPLLIRSSQSGTARNWSGVGELSIVDVDVQDQNASAVSGGITAFTSTNSGNNTNWIFDPGCPVEITAQPTDQRGCPGGLTTFTVSATGDSLTFQWRKNAVALVDGGNISGATTTMLNINPTAAGDVGSYDVVATNRFGVTATSTAANLTLLAPPMIISQPVSAIRCETEPVTFTVGATGDGLTFQWRKEGNPIFGANGSSYSIPSVAASHAGNYDVVVSGTCSPPAISSVATLTVNTAPAITSQPANQEACEGSSASFSVTATGTNLSFQWRKNGTPLSDGDNISGANTATLTINPAGTGDAGTYDVEISGTCAPSAISNSVSLTVNICFRPDLTIAKTHAASFTRGQTGATYSITVTNVGSASTTDTVTISDTVPTGLTATAIGGPGWNCTQPGGPCARSDDLNAGDSYPALTLTVDVANDAPPSVTNTAIVSGGGDITPDNNTADDLTVINAEPTPAWLCSLTQDFYGNADGVFLHNEHRYNGFVTSNLVRALLGDLSFAQPSPPIGPYPQYLTVGEVGSRSLTIPLSAAQCIITRLPASGNASALPNFGQRGPVDRTLSDAPSCQIASAGNGDKLLPINSKTGKFDNVLLGQTISLELNIRLDSALADLDLTNIGTQIKIKGKLYRQFCTQGTNPDGTPIDGDFRTLIIAQSVIQALSDPSIVGEDNVGRVSGLLVLANRALARMPTGSATVSQINAAVDAINRGLDKCRLLVSCPI